MEYNHAILIFHLAFSKIIMSLAEEDIELINHIVKQAINDRPELKNANVRYEIDLRERTIRVEEELKHQRELMIEGFKQMEKRFEQVDKRFEQMEHHFEKRFEQVDKRIEQMDKRIEQVDKNSEKRFEQMDKNSVKRFEQMDKRFTEMGRRLDRFMFWSLGLTISAAIFVVNYLK